MRYLKSLQVVTILSLFTDHIEHGIDELCSFGVRDHTIGARLSELRHKSPSHPYVVPSYAGLRGADMVWTRGSSHLK